nr:immunoglobulin light chain junction region [Mus musculus]NSM03089.1 immunoglobulin light chain junction region [Mus musculus]NSM03096.1 immunoglobulin light chain junction region [Mus musculus]NSM03097.1 immunoglobulin light chain junction region [Mus musculus]NSM03106.1 immunoglobulin light chain junction region [Mus musculus]
CALWNSNHWVF